MERLTRRMCGGWGVVEGCELNTVQGMRRVVERLAAYENTELTPKEIVELEKYMEIEKEGRLIELPCELGGTVYANFALCGDYLREKDKPYPCEVVFIGLSKEPFLHIQFKNGRIFPFKFSEVGKTVFTTREAAEAALKEQEG